MVVFGLPDSAGVVALTVYARLAEESGLAAVCDWLVITATTCWQPVGSNAGAVHLRRLPRRPGAARG